MNLQILQFQHRLENFLQIHIQTNLCSFLRLPVCHCGKWLWIPRLCLLLAVRRGQHWSNPKEWNKQGKNKKKRQWLFGGETSEQNCVYRMRGWVCSCSEHRLIPWCPRADTIPAALLCWCSVTAQGSRTQPEWDWLRSCYAEIQYFWSFCLRFTFQSILPFTSSIINVLNPVLEKTNEKEWNPSPLKWTNTGKKNKHQVKFSHLKFQQECICLLCWKLSGVLPL